MATTSCAAMRTLDASESAQAHDLPATHAVKRGQRVEHEYNRPGALCYFAAWDAKRAKLFDRCDDNDGIVPFEALVEQFMSVEPYTKAQRVFVIVDNAQRPRQEIDQTLQGSKEPAKRKRRFFDRSGWSV